MTSRLNPRWSAATLIWLTVLFVSYLNLAQIQKIATIREENDRLRKEMLFQHHHAVQLDRIQSIRASYYLPVASAKLGFESVRSRLYGLAAHLGLSNIKIDAQMAQATEGRVPLRLNMAGTFQKAANFIAALQSLPYLALKKSRVVVAYPEPDAQIELEFDFQFTIDPARELEIRALQAAADPRDQKAATR
jgi:Tfp pilus assembly protein PilO